MARATSRWVWVAGLVITAGCGGSQALQSAQGPSAAQAPLPPLEVKQKRVFRGPDGLRLEVVDLAGERALVRALGIESELTGVVLRYERVQDGRWLRYVGDYHGRKLAILVRSDASGGRTRWRAYIPDASRDGFEVQYDEALSAALEVEPLHRAHLQQDAAGTLAALSEFSRKREESKERESIERDVAHTARECGEPVLLEVAWDTVSDQQLLDKSVSGYCGSLLSGLRNLCRTETGRRFVKAHVQRAECRLDGNAELSLSRGTLRWAISFGTANLDQKARDALYATVPPGGDRPLRAEILDEQTHVCADAKREHVILVGPRDAAHGGLAYGHGKAFVRVPSPSMLSEGWFFDPRQRDDKRNPSFRGYDLRVFSYVEPDPKAGTCKLLCGTRETSLTMLKGEEKAALLREASYQPSPHGREPYALARDKRGNYYYVDRGATEATAKDFRLYKGKRGRLKPLAMKDVVSDSEGEIFASESGRLRLVVGREAAEWVTGKRKRSLLLLPLRDNWELIYNELGVYLGKRLGTPCDDF